MTDKDSLFPFVKVDHTMRDKTAMPGACTGPNPGVDEMLPEEVCLVNGIILIAGGSLAGWSANSLTWGSGPLLHMACMSPISLIGSYVK
jgi:hypothetical protein